MNHEVSYDELANLVILRVLGKLTEDDIIELSWDNERYNENYSLILDLSQATAMLDKKTRQRLRYETQTNPPSRTAIILSNSGFRVIVNLLMKISAKTEETKFFETEEEARRWLKKEVKVSHGS